MILIKVMSSNTFTVASRSWRSVLARRLRRNEQEPARQRRRRRRRQAGRSGDSREQSAASVPFDGPLPATRRSRWRPIRPACSEQRTAPASRPTWSKNGGLDNVFVYVKDGLGKYHFETPTEPVKLEPEGLPVQAARLRRARRPAARDRQQRPDPAQRARDARPATRSSTSPADQGHEEHARPSPRLK